MTDKTPARPELPEPELGYIETDKSRQPAFSARQMREALQSAQPAAPGVTGAMQTLIETLKADPEYAWAWHCNVAMATFDEGLSHYAANKAAARFLSWLAQIDTTTHPGFPKAPAQPAAAVSDEAARLAEQLSNIANGVRICGVHDRHFVSNRLHEIARAILALRPQVVHPDTARCIKARNDLNAALHGEGALIDDLEHAVANACAKLLRPQALAGEREAFEAWFDDYYDKACAEFGGIDCTDPKGIAEDAWQARASLPTQPAAQATPQADPLNPGWCVGCNPDNCMGCGIGLNKAQATPDHAAEIARLKAVIDQLERREIQEILNNLRGDEPTAGLI